MAEHWRAVVGYEGYYSVSDQGRIRSDERVITDSLGRNRSYPSVVLRPQKHSNTRYFHVTLRKNGKPETALIHQLVMAAFVGPVPAGMECLHQDDDANNSALSNLRYGTRSENNYDKVRNGRDHNARKTECKNGHKYTPENTYTYDGRRHCKACAIKRATEWKRARKAAA